MQVKAYGTRGSIPICRATSYKYGGNTTCLRIYSDCFPSDFAFAVDAGSGYIDLSTDALREGKKHIGLIFTHYHHDHTMALPLAAHTHVKGTLTRVWGPSEHGEGPRQIAENLMREPYFPVNFAKVRDRFDFRPFKVIGTEVLVIHPKAGFHVVPVDVYQKGLANGKTIDVRGIGKVPINECLLVFMYKTAHPEYTVSYAFVEGTTGRKFVFLTDHEVTTAIAKDLREHVRGADLLIQDGQYSHERYMKETGGFGHGTPEYCAELAIAGDVKRLLLTHHDPNATDEDVEKRLAEAQQHAIALGHEQFAKYISAAADYQIYDV